ncbi:MAG: DNA repair protein RecO [Phycisphaerae bacterium]
MRLRTDAICLRTTDYSETSQVVHFFTREGGLVKVIAKGSKRPKSKSGGALDVLAEGELVYSESRSGGLGTLIEFNETAWRTPLRRSAEKLNVAMYMLEVTASTMAEDDPHPEAFELLSKAMRRLTQEDAPAQAVLAYFQWKLLHWVGLLGEMGVCVACGGELGEVARGGTFSSRQGGLLCEACQGASVEKFRIDPATRQGLVTMRSVQGRRPAGGAQRASLPDDQARAVNRLLEYHLTEQLGRRLRTARYVIG